MQQDKIYLKLKELFPNCINGFIGSEARVIVGYLGLDINWYYTNPEAKKYYKIGEEDETPMVSTLKETRRWNENEEIGIELFDEQGITIRPFIDSIKIPYDKFKGLTWTRKEIYGRTS